MDKTRKWFWMDLISTIPFDVFIGFIASAFFGDGLRKSATFLRYFRLTKLFQLLRLLRLTRIFRTKACILKFDSPNLICPLKFFKEVVKNFL